MSIFTKLVPSISCTLLYSLVAAFSLPSLAETRSISIGKIRNSDLFKPRGFTCSLIDRQNRHIFTSDTIVDKALMNIDGRDTFLKLVDRIPYRYESTESIAPGGIYRVGDLKVKVNFTTPMSGVGDGKYQAQANITASRGNRSKIFLAKAYCTSV
jgi:hypothetical protein